MPKVTTPRESANDTARPENSKLDGIIGKAPELTRSWGPFLAFVATITFAGCWAATMSRSDTGVTVVGILTGTALVVALVTKLKRVV